MANAAPPVPTNIIKLTNYEIERSELTIKRSARSVPNLEHCSLTGRFSYVLDGLNINICDLFTETERKIVPKKSSNIVEIVAYIRLSANKMFIVHKSIFTHVSIISIDFDEEAYELLDDFIPLSDDNYVYSYDITFCSSSNVIIVNCNYHVDGPLKHKLHLFKLDNSFSTIKHLRSIDIPIQCCWFNIIDDKMIFPEVSSEHDSDTMVILSFTMINEDNSLATLKNTGATLKAKLPPIIGIFRSAPMHPQGLWRENKFFFFYNLHYSNLFTSTISHINHHPFSITPYLWTFELEKMAWTEIKLNVSDSIYNYFFNVDCDGILTLLKHEKSDDSTFIRFYRIPLRKPDTLFNLCWFQSRKYGILNKSTQIKNALL